MLTLALLWGGLECVSDSVDDMVAEESELRRSHDQVEVLGLPGRHGCFLASS